MKKIVIILLSIVILLTQTSFTKPEKITTIPLIEVNNLFLVRLKFNDKYSTFLLDTGSVVSLVDINQSRRYKFQYDRYDDRVFIGLGGERYRYNVYNYEIKHDDQVLIVRMFGVNLNNFTGKFIGILGADFLNENDAIIDYKNNSLILRD